MKKLGFIFVGALSLVCSVSLGADLSFLNSDSPIAQKDSQELFMYAGVSSKDSSTPCWALLQIKHDGKKVSLNGIMDTLESFPNFDTNRGETDLHLFYSHVSQVNPKKLKVVVGDHGFYRRYYFLHIGDSAQLTSLTVGGHDRFLQELIGGDAVEDFNLQCVGLKNIRDVTQVNDSNAKQDINDFMNGNLQ